MRMARSLTHALHDTPAPVETGDEPRCGLANGRNDLADVAIDSNDAVLPTQVAIRAQRVGQIGSHVTARILMHNLHVSRTPQHLARPARRRQRPTQRSGHVDARTNAKTSHNRRVALAYANVCTATRNQPFDGAGRIQQRVLTFSRVVPPVLPADATQRKRTRPVMRTAATVAKL